MSLPLALKTSSFALAGSIPKEFGKLINMKNLELQRNNLSGTPPSAHFTCLVARVYHCNHAVVVVVVVVVVAAVQVVFASGGASHRERRCAPTHSVSYPPGAQVKRSSTRS